MRQPFKEIVCLIPTWLTATHALNAAKSFQNYYPDIPIYFVDDISSQDDINVWNGLNKEGLALDPDSSKLIGFPNSAYILRRHEGLETEGHGNAITHAMKFIHAKWVIHLSADVRMLQYGIIEHLMKGTDSKYCGMGDDFSRGGPPNLGKWFCIFRGDLYHKYGLNFYADSSKRLDAGQMYFDFLTRKGYKLKMVDFSSFFIHLTNSYRDHEEIWDKYYKI